MKTFGWLKTDMMLSPNDLNNEEIKFELKGRSAIYRFYDKQGTLLYIGYSSGILNRLRTHLLWKTRDCPYRKDVSKVLLTFNFKNVEQSVKNIEDDVEHFMIRALRPVYNKKYYKDVTYMSLLE
jgi:excinuclease UvrABC nuclease subunit